MSTLFRNLSSRLIAVAVLVGLPLAWGHWARIIPITPEVREEATTSYVCVDAAGQEVTSRSTPEQTALACGQYVADNGGGPYYNETHESINRITRTDLIVGGQNVIISDADAQFMMGGNPPGSTGGGGVGGGGSFDSSNLILWDPIDYTIAADDIDWVTTIQASGAQWATGDACNNDIGSYPPASGPSGDKGCVYFSTVTSSACGPIPGENGRALKVESIPNPDHSGGSYQADGDLVFGTSNESEVPGHVLIQGWYCFDSTAPNNFSTAKLYYFSKGASQTATSQAEQDTLCFFGVNSYLPNHAAASGGENFFFCYPTYGGSNAFVHYGESGDGACFQSGDEWKLGFVASGTPLPADTWILLQLEMDTSETAVLAGTQFWQGKFREQGTEPWTVFARWEDGETYEPGSPSHNCRLTWDVDYMTNGEGHKRMAFPTTMSDVAGLDNPWYFLVTELSIIAGSNSGGLGEAGLKGFSDYGY